MEIKPHINPEDYEVGVIIARFQVHELHDAHKALIDKVHNNHKKVIIFLGVPIISNTKQNPLDFATRKAMVQEYAPNAVILPLKDQRSNAKWSYILDNEIKVPFGERTTLIYGGRDSFIPYYEGSYTTTELTTDVYVSGTEIRNRVSRELLNSSDFRAGIIHATYSKRAVTWSTVDVCPYNTEGQILLGRKPNENVWRFIGGFLDRTDSSDEMAAQRELREEAGMNINVGPMEYVTSQAIDDWRYAKVEDGIMTRLFITPYLWGPIEPSDDISELKWFDLTTFESHDNIVKHIMPEHQSLMRTLVDKKFNTIMKCEQPN
jgi:bifunctional NMN adenylyltransferase/nudix hydrolase